jgi:hypothetical protein
LITLHLNPFNNQKIYLHQFNPLFFEGINLNYIVFEK